MTEHFVGVNQSTIGQIFRLVDFKLTARQMIAVQRELTRELSDAGVTVNDASILVHPYEDKTKETVFRALGNTLGSEVKHLQG